MRSTKRHGKGAAIAAVVVLSLMMAIQTGGNPLLAGSKSSRLQAHRPNTGTRIVCGDGVILRGEDCEDQNLKGQSCQSLGFVSGNLSCTDCQFDRSDCVPRTETGRPAMFISATEIQAIKSRKNQEPWASAYAALIDAADEALDQARLSVTDNGGQTADSHHFATDRAYSSDGVYDPDADRYDYRAATEVSGAIVDLGLAYALTGESEYGRKAVRLIRTWALSPSTYMVPEVENYGETSTASANIEIFITIPGMFYGAELVWDSTQWGDGEREAFVEWARAIGNDARNNFWPLHNNIKFWEIFASAAAGAFAKDEELLEYAFDEWKSELALQVADDGSLPEELDRTRSLSYSLFAMDAMTQTAEIAKHHGVNLYDYLVDGKSLKEVFDFHAPYVARPSSWPHEMISPHSANEDLSAFELANSHWRRPNLLYAIASWGRPVRNIYILDHATLTHGLQPEPASGSQTGKPGR